MPQSSFDAVNVTPLIDVVMCMIIFFLIVGKLATDRGLAVRLPESIRGSEETSPAVLIVTVAKFDQAPERIGEQSAFWKPYGITVQADGEVMTDAKALETAIRGKMAAIPTTSIQVRAHRDLAWGAVEPVLRTCGQAGAKSVRLATERAQ
jgi:biopolymer transport protein ExbD